MESYGSKRIVVGVDGSDSSIAALRYAARIAQALDAPLEAVTAWYYPSTTVARLMMDWTPEQDATDTLTTAIEHAFGGTPPARLIRTVAGGPPARTLIEMSADCEMLVLGNRGHGGFAELLLGSVSATCVRHAHAPVLVIRPRKIHAEP